ncbi:MAG: histidine phosphatase family protein [Elusimicrobiaceae bacterium]|nr:histidine phosphatase family protein [Elusimicrobiaceae bacterium]
MKTLILMRHGHAYSAIQSGVARDEDRPLSEDGVEGAIRAAAELKNRKIALNAVIGSPLLRAVQTAREISGAFGLEPGVGQYLGGGFSVSDMWERDIAPQLARHDSVLVVGHLPGIGILAGTLLGKGELPLPAGGFYVLKLETAPGKLEPGGATLDFAYI